MDLMIYAVIVGLAVFWAVMKVMMPKYTSYASQDFIRAENIEEAERNIVHRSKLHKITYPFYQRLEKVKPTNVEHYEKLQKMIEEAGEYDMKPEDIQIYQLFNAVFYPLVFTILSFFTGEYQIYIFAAGLMVGFWMYQQPINTIKNKVKKNEKQMLQDMTRFTTIYMLISAGNKTPYDALLSSIKRTADRCPALGNYLQDLKNDMVTHSAEQALRKFSWRLKKFPYIERFVNNIILIMSKGDDQNQEINMRLRQTLNDMDEEMTNQLIKDTKVQARIPTYINALLISIYLMVIFVITLFTMF
ncbi:hypothetical protein [Salibacterium aidingense]|uniref:hypothetical protein n=1 Tax=Salibacterium aidingense TaxID=384933 RepID=UPI0004014CF8|nr:hypothetical protein [Salibacterium aidingense]